MSAMPRKRRLAVKASFVAMGQLRTPALQKTLEKWATAVPAFDMPIGLLTARHRLRPRPFDTADIC
jgi:hypothetical protein